MQATTKTFSLIAAMATGLVASAGAMAQEATPDTWMQTSTSKSREQVREELAQARKDGTIRFTSAGYMEKMPVSRTRLQVQAEVIAARNSGELQQINAEAYAFGTPAQRPVVTAEKKK